MHPHGVSIDIWHAGLLTLIVAPWAAFAYAGMRLERWRARHR